MSEKANSEPAVTRTYASRCVHSVVTRSCDKLMKQACSLKQSQACHVYRRYCWWHRELGRSIGVECQFGKTVLIYTITDRLGGLSNACCETFEAELLSGFHFAEPYKSWYVANICGCFVAEVKQREADGELMLI